MYRHFCSWPFRWDRRMWVWPVCTQMWFTPNSCAILRSTCAGFILPPPFADEHLSTSVSAQAVPQTRPRSGGPWACTLGSEQAWPRGGSQCPSGRAAVDTSLGFPSLFTPICLSSVLRTVSVSSLWKAFPLVLSLSPTH